MRKEGTNNDGKDIFSEDRFPRASKEDVFPAIAFEKTARTFGISGLMFHMRDKLRLVTKTGRRTPPVLLLALLIFDGLLNSYFA